MTTERTTEVLAKLRLPMKCSCGDPICNSTSETRFSMQEREALQEAIRFYLDKHLRNKDLC